MAGAAMICFAGTAVAVDNRAEIAPMLKTRWHQGAPFNDQCPVSGRERSATGSEATAMAQVMKYHNWPETADDGISFDWSNMLESYTSEATDAQKKAVATLMQSAGEAIGTQYGAESTADDYRIAPALIDKFGYDKSATLMLKKYYSPEQWENIIYEQLSKYGPVIYKGYDESGGHTFVIDGYRKDGYFHVNWGWGGVSDGYYQLSSLTPEKTGIDGVAYAGSGFNDKQSAVVNICKPQRNSTYLINVLSDDRFLLARSQDTGEYAVAVPMNIYTVSSIELTGTPTILFVSDNSSIAAIGKETTLQPGVKIDSYEVALPENIPDGSYEIMPVFEYNKMYLPIQTPFGAVKTAGAEVSNGEITITNDNSGIVRIGADGCADAGDVVKIYDLNGFETDAATLSPGIYIVETRDAAGNLSRRLVRK